MTAESPCLLTRAETGAPETLMEAGDFRISCAVGPVTTIEPENCSPRLDCTFRLFMEAKATVEPLAINKPVTSFKFIFDLDIIPQSLYLYINSAQFQTKTLQFDHKSKRHFNVYLLLVC